MKNNLSVLDEMSEAKRRYKYLRENYLDKIEKIKKHYSYDLGGHRGNTTAKKEIILGLVFNLSIGWWRFNINHHWDKDRDSAFFYHKGSFNPAQVFHLKKDKKLIYNQLSADDWRYAVNDRSSMTLGFEDWKKSMMEKEIEEVINILCRRKRFNSGIYSVPELFGKQEYFILARKDDENYHSGHHL